MVQGRSPRQCLPFPLQLLQLLAQPTRLPVAPKLGCPFPHGNFSAEQTAKCLPASVEKGLRPEPLGAQVSGTGRK